MLKTYDEQSNPTLTSDNEAVSPSSRGLGHSPFTGVTGVRIPVETPIKKAAKSIALAAFLFSEVSPARGAEGESPSIPHSLPTQHGRPGLPNAARPAGPRPSSLHINHVIRMSSPRRISSLASLNRRVLPGAAVLICSALVARAEGPLLGGVALGAFREI